MFSRNILQSLREWANSKRRKPLILRGARQVGKTTVVKLFAEEFEQYVHLNLEKNADRRFFEAGLSVDALINSIFLSKNKKSDSKKTLLFIDEIQTSPEAVAILRYFYEEANHIYVIAAGSLLETLINTKISFPVGRVSYLAMRPCSFTEFLVATENDLSVEILDQIPLPEYAHDNLQDLFKQYAIIGGMPEVIAEYADTGKIFTLKSIYESLLTSYIDDVEKYGRNDTMIKVIRHVIKNSFGEAGNRFKFEGFGNSSYKSREVGEAFRVLEKAFFLHIVYPTASFTIPAITNIRRAPKLQIMDTGFVTHFAGVQTEMLLNSGLNNVFTGRIAEHITGQELLVLSDSVLYEMKFWTREVATANAEVDFIYQHKGLIIPIEVKAGATGRLRSLFQFIDAAPHNFAVRVYSGKLKIENAVTIKGKTFRLLNLPFYLINKLPQYLDFLIGNSNIRDKTF